MQKIFILHRIVELISVYTRQILQNIYLEQLNAFYIILHKRKSDFIHCLSKLLLKCLDSKTRVCIQGCTHS